MGNDHPPQRGIAATRTRIRAYDGLVLTGYANLQYVLLRSGKGATLREAIATTLGADRIESEHLRGDIDLWRDLEAVINEDPIMNFGAMWLVQQLRGPIGVPVIYGDVLFTGRGADGEPMPLSVAAVKLFRHALTGHARQGLLTSDLSASRSPNR